MIYDITRVLAVMKDVRVRESTIAINDAMSRILPFPCSFQIVGDKISAFDQAMMQPYQVIILPLRCTEVFSNASFLEYIARVDDQTTLDVVYLIESDDDGDEDESKRLLRLTEDSSIPVHELAQLLSAIVYGPAAQLPAAEISSPAHSAEEIGYATGVQRALSTSAPERPSLGRGGRSQGSKRKLTLTEAIPVHPAAAAPARAQSQCPPPAPRRHHVPAYDTDAAAAYQQQGWLAAQAQEQAHREWFLQQQSALLSGRGAYSAAPHLQAEFPAPPRMTTGIGCAQNTATSVQHGAHRVVTAENATEENQAFSRDVLRVGPVGSDLNDLDADHDAFSCYLDGFDDADAEDLFSHGLGTRE